MFTKSIEECLEIIKKENSYKDNQILYLQEELRKLKEEYSKDSEIQKMNSALEKMRKDYWRGFPISEDEKKKIDEWKEKHDIEAHGLNTFDKKLKAGGCIGGRYSYKFVPTSIGISGKIVCNCGAEFEFQEIG